METLIIWGTGAESAKLMRILDPNRFEVAAFCESESGPENRHHLGKPVISPQDIAGFSYDYIVIASAFHQAIRKTIAELSLDCGEVLCTVTQPFATRIRFATKEHVPPELTANLAIALDGCRWFHRIELLPGIFSPGATEYRAQLMEHPCCDFKGKRVLDIGAWDGLYTFEAERRGAHVTAMDIQHPDRTGFNIARRLKSSCAQHIIGSVDTLNPLQHGMFDIVQYFGVYYHLYNPLQSFINISKVLPFDGILLFEGAILDHADTFDPWWQRHQERLQTVRDIPLCLYVKGTYGHNEDWSTWFVPNALCLQQWIETAGFEIVTFGIQEDASRGYGMAIKKRELPLEHEIV